MEEEEEEEKESLFLLSVEHNSVWGRAKLFSFFSRRVLCLWATISVIAKDVLIIQLVVSLKSISCGT